jgi:stalled ribosome rescue protein Dom34
MSKHVVVWLDHQEARIYYLHPDRVDEASLAAPNHHHLKHPRGAAEPKAHPDDAKRFFHEVVRSIEDSQEILIVGPSTAKLELIRYLHKHAPKLEPNIIGVETIDHPTPGELINYAKKYFAAADRMR